MKSIKSYYPITALIVFLLVAVSCERKFDGLELATYPTTPEVFIDGFSAGLYYSAYGTSKVTAFSVDKDVKYSGTASMRFDVPDQGDPNGSYVGGVFGTNPGRDLSGYNVLTFWAKASQPAKLNEAGFGNDMGESKYKVTATNVALNSNWMQYYIPFPDPSVLQQERGMFFYSAAPQNEKGYTIWIDEVKFENLGTIAHQNFGILNGRDSVKNGAENGEVYYIADLYGTFNLPTGVDQKVGLTSSYFTFASSNSAVASVDNLGKVLVVNSGSAVITAKVGDSDAKGSLTINSVGAAVGPAEPAPTPSQESQDVISLYSNTYTNVKVDTWNTHWLYSTAENQFVQIQGDDAIRYKNLNFVGIEFTSEPVNASAMTYFHMDIWTPDPTASKTFKVMLIDFGANGVYGGGDDSSSEISVTSPTLSTGSWISLNIPMSNFTGLTSKSHLAQMVLSGDIPNVYVDNVYFYKGSGGAAEPTTAAPTPTRNAANVISIFSDAYTNVAGTDLNPNWGQSTVVSQIPVAGNNTLKYAGLNYQGIVLGSNQNVSGMGFLHLDFWTTNSTLLNVFLISPGPVEKPFSLTVPTSGWSSVEIPLSSFSPVDLANVFQLKFEGNGDIFIDNIYFYKSGTGAYTLDSPIDFESSGYGAGWTWNVFENSTNSVLEFVPNPDKTGVNTSTTVAKFTALQAGAQWAGCETQHGAMGTFTLDAAHCIVKIMVYKTVLSDVGIKFAKSDGWSMGEIKVPNTVVNAWQELTFNFTAQLQAGYDQIVIFPDFKARTSDNVIYFDNITFSGGGAATEPTAAAPTPTRDAANVISIFSDAYTNVAGTDLNPSWGQSTVVSQIPVAGNNTLKYAGLNYQGIVLGSNQNVSGMGFLHLDFWTANSTLLNVFLISPGPVEKSFTLTVPTSGWSGVDIPLSSFSPVDLANVFQLKFEGNGDIFIDNIYFYKSATGYTLGNPIDFESSGYGAAWTWNVFENSTNPALQFVPNPDKTGANTSATVAKFTALQAGAQWAGCETQHGAMGTFTLDAAHCIVKIMVYKTVLSDVGIKFAKSDGWSMGEIKVPNTVVNAWQELTFNFTAQVQAGYDQIIVFPDFKARTSDNVIYFDNITFSSSKK
jgi:hypothetical protein